MSNATLFFFCYRQASNFSYMLQSTRLTQVQEQGHFARETSHRHLKCRRFWTGMSVLSHWM